MIPTSKLLWGEGLFLRPQHFQRQDAYHEWRLAEAMRSLHPYAWGVRSLRVNEESLQTGVLRIDELSLVFRDGEFYSSLAGDELPPPFSLADWPAQHSELAFHIATAPLRPNGSNAALGAGAGDVSARYGRSSAPAVDWFTQAAEAQVQQLRCNVRLVPDHLPHDHLVSLPLCRVRRNASGGFDLDARFVPPSLTLKAAPALQALLRQWLEMLQAKVDALVGLHREPTKHVVEFRSGDVASFWLLHTASSACASLQHYRHHPGLHPERLFERLLDLAGALMTYSKSHTLADLPAYDHEEPGTAFYRLDTILRELLETVISTRYFAVPLAQVKPAFLLGQLVSESITASTALYLAATSSLPALELAAQLPTKLKVGSPEDVDKIALAAVSGVKLVHAPQPPGAIPARPGTTYFAVEARGALYERMMSARAISIYAPPGERGLPDLKLELYAVNP